MFNFIINYFQNFLETINTSFKSIQIFFYLCIDVLNECINSRFRIKNFKFVYVRLLLYSSKIIKISNSGFFPKC